jgi:hypothetical protein
MLVRHAVAWALNDFERHQHIPIGGGWRVRLRHRKALKSAHAASDSTASSPPSLVNSSDGQT